MSNRPLGETQIREPTVSVARTTTVSVTSTVAAAVPIMLVGALSVLIRADIPLDEARLGTGVSVYFLSAGISSVVGGRLAEGVSGRPAVRSGLLASGLAMAAIGFLAQEWWHIVAALVLAGAATGFIHPAVNLVLARQVPSRLQGILFGVKQAAVPTASLLAGLSVALVSGVGWRWAFLVAAAAAVLMMPFVPRWPRLEISGSKDRARPHLPYLPVLLAGSGGALASGAANAMAIFFILFAASTGLEVSLAAGLLVIASVTGIVSRVASGLLAGKMRRNPFWLVAMMVAIGAVGYLVLATANTPLTGGVGLMLGFAAGWGWPGVMLLGVVQVSPGAPAAASGVVQGATFFGAILGPSVFGFVASSGSYSQAWLLMSIGAAVGAVLIAGAAWFAKDIRSTAESIRSNDRLSTRGS